MPSRCRNTIILQKQLYYVTIRFSFCFYQLLQKLPFLQNNHLYNQHDLLPKYISFWDLSYH